MTPQYKQLGTWDNVRYDQTVDKFVSTLYIGLGGTGKDILMRFRKRLFERFGSCKERFATFLAIDTDDQSHIPRGEKDTDYMPVIYEQDEFIKCTIDHSTFKSIVNRVKTRGDRRYKEWLHPEIDTKISAGSLETGAGTHRQIGRLAFFNNYRAIRDAIEQKFGDMMAYAAEKPTSFFNGVEGEVYPDRLEVVLLTSLAGGTGSGMFIDIAYLIRDILSDEAFRRKSCHTTVMAILPTIYGKSDPNLAERFKQNAYASLLEMEHYHTPRPEENPFRSEDDSLDFKPVQFRVNWDDSRENEKVIEEHAWDTCYLIDDVNDPQHDVKRKHADLYQMVSDYLFLDFGASGFAVAKRSARSNHTQLKERMLAAQVLDDEQAVETLAAEQRDLGADVLFESKYGCAFNSFGLSEIFIDKEGVNRSASYRLALQIVIRRWLGDAEQYTNADYDRWTKEDLFSGAPPTGETESISFHPDDLWKTLLVDRELNRDWLKLMEGSFDEIDRSDPSDGIGKLRAELKEHRESLSRSTRADGTSGAARQTLDNRLSELSGTATVLGKMRERLYLLARQRFNRIGVRPTLQLLEHYHKTFRLAAKRAGEQQRLEILRDHSILDRLEDAERVPFPCKRIATRIEFSRACQKARETVQKQYEVEAAVNLETLSNTLRVYVGEAKQDANAMPIHTSLYGEYQRIRKFLEELAISLKKRFDETRTPTTSDRREPLLPEWTDNEYDQEINKALLEYGSSDGKTFDWAPVEAKFLEEIDSVSFAELIDESLKEFETNQNILNDIVERIGSACRRMLNNRIDLDSFKDGNIVDYLVAMKDNTSLLDKLAAASAAYLPSIAPQDRHGIQPAYRNLLGRALATGVNGARFTNELDNKIQQNATAIAHRDNEGDELATIHSKEVGDPSSLVFVREMGGVPIHFYGRLSKLRDAYFSNENREFRKTCHIRFRDDYRNLPDIETISDGDYQKIQLGVEDVLRALLLKFIRYDGDMFVITVPLEGDIGPTVRLGTRISRVIMHACKREDVGNYLKRRWSVWKERATATDMAVLYSAIQQNQRLFPSMVSAGDKDQRIPPVRNCFRKLLRTTKTDLEAYGDVGRKWLDILRLRDEGTDLDYDTWQPTHDEISKKIRETCLVQVDCDSLPIYQIDEKKTSEIELPGGQSDEPSDPIE